MKLIDTPNPNAKKIELDTNSSFQDIKDGLCRWPLGEPEEIDFKFCGRSTNEGFVYCQAHHKQAYQPLNKVRERKKIKKKFRIS